MARRRVLIDDNGDGYDWDALRAEYLSMGRGRRRYTELAKKHGIPYVTVRDHAQRQRWRDAAKEFDRKVAIEAEAMVVRKHAERMTLFLSAVDDYIDQFRALLAVNGVAIEANSLVGLMKLAMVHAGEATERVEVVEVREVLVAWTQIALTRIPEGEREPFLADLRHRIGELAALN